MEKDRILFFILGMLIGNLFWFKMVCNEKDKMINLLGRIKSPQIEQISQPPKNLPIITDFRK